MPKCSIVIKHLKHKSEINNICGGNYELELFINVRQVF